jgi:serine/threonine protein phosphatase PrpC
MRLELATAEYIGARPQQQDLAAAVPLRTGALLILADGLGGHESGAEASRIVVETFREAAAGGLFDDPAGRRQALKATVELANARIGAGVDPAHGHRGMASTAVAAVVANGELIWVSVGDSHLYVWRGGRLAKLNEDHSQAGLMVRSGQYKADDPEVQAVKSVLVSALTGRKLEIVDLPQRAFKVESGDVLMLASDGLNTLDDGEIGRIVAARQGEGAVRLSTVLLETVRGRRVQRQDNTTVAVARVLATSARPAREDTGASRTVTHQVTVPIDADLEPRTERAPADEPVDDTVSRPESARVPSARAAGEADAAPAAPPAPVPEPNGVAAAEARPPPADGGAKAPHPTPLAAAAAAAAAPTVRAEAAPGRAQPPAAVPRPAAQVPPVPTPRSAPAPAASQPPVPPPAPLPSAEIAITDPEPAIREARARRHVEDPAEPRRGIGWTVLAVALLCLAGGVALAALRPGALDDWLPASWRSVPLPSPAEKGPVPLEKRLPPPEIGKSDEPRTGKEKAVQPKSVAPDGAGQGKAPEAKTPPPAEVRTEPAAATGAAREGAVARPAPAAPPTAAPKGAGSAAEPAKAAAPGDGGGSGPPAAGAGPGTGAGADKASTDVQSASPPGPGQATEPSPAPALVEPLKQAPALSRPPQQQRQPRNPQAPAKQP